MPNIMTVELPDLSASRRADLVGGGEAASPLPLRGITVLAVEDSRFASEALRLMCQRLGARLRRAETIHSARAHLRLYRPHVVIVDLGLPDGRGEALIREIVLSPVAPFVLGTSGDAGGRALALAAGAEGFLDKPFESLAAFQDLLIRHLPDRIASPLNAEPALQPDRLALRDDFARAATLIEAGVPDEGHAYLTGFLSGVARHAHDDALTAALTEDTPQRLNRVRDLLARRLARADRGFGPGQTPGQFPGQFPD